MTLAGIGGVQLMANWLRSQKRKPVDLRYDPITKDYVPLDDLVSIYEDTAATVRFTRSIDPYNKISETLLQDKSIHSLNQKIAELDLAHIDALANNELVQGSIGKGFAGSGAEVKANEYVYDKFKSDINTALYDIDSQRIADESEMLTDRMQYIDEIWDLYGGLARSGLEYKDPTPEGTGTYFVEETTEIYQECIGSGYSTTVCDEFATDVSTWNDYLGDLTGLDETEIVDIVDLVEDSGGVCGVGSWCCPTYEWWSPCCWC